MLTLRPLVVGAGHPFMTHRLFIVCFFILCSSLAPSQRINPRMQAAETPPEWDNPVFPSAPRSRTPR